MPPLLGNRIVLGLLIVAAVLVDIRPAASQVPRFLGGPPSSTDLAPARVFEPSGGVAARLEQAALLADHASWDEAADVYRDVAAAEGDRVVEVADGRFVNLSDYCQMRIAGWGPEGLSAYRERVDPLAEQWYREGIAKRDRSLLRRIVDEAFCSSWGDDALRALGEMALEQGDHDEARRNWEQIARATRDPTGRTVWSALGGIDLEEHWPEIAKRWAESAEPSTWLCYPDSQIPIAEVRAWLVLASIRAGELERAELELAAFRRFHPGAIGRLGGREASLVETLEGLLTAARDWGVPATARAWPTFGGSPSRWSDPPHLAAELVPTWSRRTAPPANRSGVEMLEPPRSFPVVENGTVYLDDGEAVRGYDLATGDAATTPDGVLFRRVATGSNILALPIPPPVATARDRTLTAQGGILYMVADPPRGQTVDSREEERLLGFDLTRDGLLQFQARAEAPEWTFTGAPLADERRVSASMRRDGAMQQAYVAAYDSATGEQLWRTRIGGAEDIAQFSAADSASSLLTMGAGRLFLNTNLGIVAALRVDDGRIEWISRYPRFQSLRIADARRPLLRQPSPCVYRRGMLFVMPVDSEAVFALDAVTGQILWQRDLPTAYYPIGIVAGRLLVAGDQLWTLDAGTGELVRVWPESAAGGLRGMGRGLVAGGEVFWPTRRAIVTLDALHGGRTRPDLATTSISRSGVNLASAGGRLVAAGTDGIMVFGPSGKGEWLTSGGGSRPEPAPKDL